MQEGLAVHLAERHDLDRGERLVLDPCPEVGRQRHARIYPGNRGQRGVRGWIHPLHIVKRKQRRAPWPLPEEPRHRMAHLDRLEPELRRLPQGQHPVVDLPDRNPIAAHGCPVAIQPERQLLACEAKHHRVPDPDEGAFHARDPAVLDGLLQPLRIGESAHWQRRTRQVKRGEQRIRICCGHARQSKAVHPGHPSPRRGPHPRTRRLDGGGDVRHGRLYRRRLPG